ncbi:MAG: GNAT family N-acetyltransferase [Bryobacteraceae bacterium]
MIEYREAGIEDVFAIARINSDTMRECGLEPPDIYDFQRLRTRWDGYVRRIHHPRHALEPRILFASVADGFLVGYIAGHFSRRHDTEGELQSIYVLKEFQGRGIGTALLTRLAEWFVGNKRRCVCVGINPKNPYKRFYDKHGARAINAHWLVWDDIGSVLRADVGAP